jgi:uncharacterized protein
MTQRLIHWRGEDPGLAEVATVDLGTAGIRASGVQLGVDPLPYRLDYELETAWGFVTRSLSIDVRGEGWWRRLDLRHDGEGAWTCKTAQGGAVDLPRAGCDAGTLDGADDCDLGLSSMTNLMPIRRHALHQRPGSVEIVVAWVSVPDLVVTRYPQRYEHVGTRGSHAIVRFTSLGVHEGFVSDLEVDEDGLVVVYPQLARRVEPPG